MPRFINFILLFILLNFQTFGQDAINASHLGSVSSRKLLEEIAYSLGQIPSIPLLKDINKMVDTDSNYYDAYRLKYYLEMKNKLYNEAFLSTRKLIELEPSIPENYYEIGLLYYLKKEKRLSKKYFTLARELFKKISDTFAINDYRRKELLFKKALNLIYTGEIQKGNALLQYIARYNSDDLFANRIALYQNKNSSKALKLATSEL